MSRADVYLLVGANPLVSVSANGFDTRNPTTMTAAADAVATLINYVTALAHAIESERFASAS